MSFEFNEDIRRIANDLVQRSVLQTTLIKVTVVPVGSAIRCIAVLLSMRYS
jgi:hypothetical protein